MKILVTGSTGLIGSAIVGFLKEKDHDVRRLHRNSTECSTLNWSPDKGLIDINDYKPDAVIHLAGDNIASGRWSKTKKISILNSRVQGTKLLSKFLANLDYKPKVLISSSAIGYYGNQGEIEVDESSELGEGFLATVCQQWEQATQSAKDADIRVVNIRTGMVLSSSGGALKKMLLPFKMGLGGVIGSGHQYISWVSIQDVVSAIYYLMVNDSIEGPVNLVSPNPVTNYQFTKTLGKVLNRPTVFPVPQFIIRIILGEMANELLLSSTKAVSAKLMDSDYKFHHSELEEALIDVLKLNS